MFRQRNVLMLILLATYLLFSQELLQVNRDSTIQNYKMENMSSISFSDFNEQILRIKKKDGTYFDFDIDKIINITFTDTSGIEDQEEILGKFGISLLKNYPNPFNPETTISFSLKNSGKTKVDIFNYLGQFVETIHNGKLMAGNHSIKWNAGNNNSSSGVYFVKISQNDQILSSKILLIK
ncbi:MAG: T9SS type A sorting domain-containing protein [Candidatus Delongbacteria bacterium]|nr:T9SS type A sorting domain-containing protein [Candidatus Delongbacteria bacterium]